MKSEITAVRRLIACLILYLSATTALSRSTLQASEITNEKLNVFVSILPQAYFVERVGGANVTVEVLAGPGKSHETFEPTPQQMSNLCGADIYFRIGLPFEDRLVEKLRAALGNLRVSDTREGVKLRRLQCEHESGGPDPHIWLDPRLVEIQASTICKEMSLLDPPNASEYRKNLQSFIADLRRVDETISQILSPLKGRKFYVYHPAYGYFADAYGLTQVAVEIEGKEPGGRQLAAIVNDAKRDNVKVIFVQPQISSKNAEVVAAAIGGKVELLDPLSRDYLRNLEEMAAKIARALGEEKH